MATEDALTPFCPQVLPPAVQKILDRKIPRGRMAQFLDGMKTPLDGFRTMNAYPTTALWRYSLAPALASLLVTCLVVAGLAAAIFYGSQSLHDQFESTWTGRAMEAGAFGLLIAGSCLVAFVVWLLCQSIFCGYFYSVLVIQVERRLGTPEDQLQEAPFTQQTIDSVVDVSRFLFVSILLLLLNIVPLLGSMASAVGTLLFDSLFAGYEFLDYPMTVRGIRRKQRRNYARQHRFVTLGLGASILGLLFVPLLGAMLLCTAAAGSPLLYHRLNASQSDTTSTPAS